jgi:hypothetical protein
MLDMQTHLSRAAVCKLGHVWGAWEGRMHNRLGIACTALLTFHGILHPLSVTSYCMCASHAGHCLVPHSLVTGRNRDREAPISGSCADSIQRNALIFMLHAPVRQCFLPPLLPAHCQLRSSALSLYGQTRDRFRFLST